jgi:hypothetical protein
MEIYDTTCETPGCAARATFTIKDSGGKPVGKHCRRHAPDALKAQNEGERRPQIAATQGQGSAVAR